MNLIIEVLQLIGFLSHPGCGYDLRRAACLILEVTVWIVLPELAFIFRHESDFAADMGSLIEVIMAGFAIPQAAIFMVHRRLLEQVLNDVKTALLEASTDPHRDVQTVLRQLETFSTWIFKGYIGLELFLASGYALSIPVMILAQYIMTGVLPPLRTVLVADYIIFDFRYNLMLWLITVIVTFVVIIHELLFLIASHCFFWSLLHNISGLFKIVRIKIMRLDEFTDKDQRHEELVEIVSLHETAYRSARAMENALNILLLLLYGMCAIEICMTMTALSLASEDRILLVKMVTVLIYMLFQMFIYSMLGTELISASTSTAEAFYATRWYQHSLSDQHNLLFALTRSQQMAVLTTGKFFFVNRITFGMALRTAVQYFTVLHQVYSSQ